MLLGMSHQRVGSKQRCHCFNPFFFLFFLQDTGLSESMEVDHNSSANFDEVCAKSMRAIFFSHFHVLVLGQGKV